jgi:hypothetical protein
MSINVTSAFETLWSSEVTNALQRNGSLLRGTVDIVSGVKASTYKFPTAGTFTVQKNKERHADLVPNNTTHGTVTATLNNYHASDYVDDLDQLKTSVNLRSIYTSNIVKGLGRSIDDDIMLALAAAATAGNTTNSNAAAAMSVDLLAEMLAISKANDAFEQGSMTLVITPGVERKILGVSGLTSGDFISEVPTQNGVRKRLMGMDIVVTSDTSLISSTTHTIYAYPKSAIGLAIGSDVAVSVREVPQKDSWIVKGSASFGSVAKQTGAVVRSLVTVS